MVNSGKLDQIAELLYRDNYELRKENVFCDDFDPELENDKYIKIIFLFKSNNCFTFKK